LARKGKVTIFKDGELYEKSVTEEFSATASDGKQYLLNTIFESDFDREVKK